jgi:hypothetical protein
VGRRERLKQAGRSRAAPRSGPSNVEGKKGFALCLGFPRSEEYMETYVEPALVAGYSA